MDTFKLRAYADPAFPVEFTTARQDQVLEVVLGETVTLAPAGKPLLDITPVAAPPGAAAAIGGADHGFTATPSAIGRYHIRVTLQGSVDVDVSLVCCEPAVLDLCGSRPVLRALAGGAAGFDGSLQSARRFNLEIYGAAPPAPLGAYPNT